MPSQFAKAFGDALTEPHEFHRDETPLSSDETPSFNDPAKSAILLM